MEMQKSDKRVAESEQTVDSNADNIASLETEMENLCNENAELSIKLQKSRAACREEKKWLESDLQKARIEGEVLQEKFDQFVNDKIEIERADRTVR